MSKPILVVNPNSSKEVTSGIREALASMRLIGGPGFECIDIPEGPETVSTSLEIAEAGVRIGRIASERSDLSAMIVACFGDPGVDVARSVAQYPVIGIMEAGICAALAVAERFAVITISPASNPRLRRRLRQMGVLDRFVGAEALSNISAADAGHSEEVADRLVEAGAALRARGADVIVMGCAGFSPRREMLERQVGGIVIDPVRAAAAVVSVTV